MFVCKHEGQYYETDRMGITNHSNYVQLMEKAELFSKEFLLLFLFRVNTKL